MGIVLAPMRGLRASLGSDRITQYDAPVGCLIINPAGVDSSLAWSEVRKNLVVAIPPGTLSELALQEFDLANVELRPPAFGVVDPIALDIAQRMSAELTGKATPNELYLDSLVTLFSTHVLRTYASHMKQPQPPRGGLSSKSARRIEEYLREHFTERVHVAELAAVAGISANHFIIRFAKTFGMPPHRYLINMRLDSAERMLIEGEIPIAEIAYLTGFSDQSHLATTMKRYRGRTPKDLRFER
ncbi:helix-turn-helix domain-containing protein [Rhizobium lusitanum]|uniref:AraC family transcriptional regulator n=1 Tax=Rhizobium lusitanum TaxID=293958 RepID=A0A7X0ISZ3_9HYPH|nr:AraC family transcriptional regulator [Rhizobium lusitanum]MBB6486603.1 AraC family transcriptional regulator [Rhizobium lusitanum]